MQELGKGLSRKELQAGKTEGSSAFSALMSYFQNPRFLHLNHPIRHHKKELGHKPFYGLSLVDKLEADGKMLALATRRAFCMEAMVITESCLWTEDRDSGNLLVVKKSQDVVVKKLTAGAYVRVEMNHHPQRRPNIQHPHSL
jgi:hypothetical protein